MEDIFDSYAEFGQLCIKKLKMYLYQLYQLYYINYINIRLYQ